MAYMISGGNRAGQVPECIDGADNDRDGLTDLEDPGCADERDEDESAFDVDNPEARPQCADGDDNDGNGTIDFPLDPGCQSAGDDFEERADRRPLCGDGIDNDSDGWIDFPFDTGCQGIGDVEERNPIRVAACGDGADNDSDGRADFPWDPGCRSASDAEENNPPSPPACDNGFDDDRDGVSDFPFDPGCASAADDREADMAEPPQCFNGIDDDDDGLTDFPFDDGCFAASDTEEGAARRVHTCHNGLDDDGDEAADFPADRGCRFAADDDETDPFRIPPQCGDGVDNDGDGFIDGQDSGCSNLRDDDESDDVADAVCGNEIDDDEDGLIDWPEDPGCQSRGDDDGEAQTCDLDEMPEIGAQTVLAATEEDGEDHFESSCGGREAPDAVFRYVNEERATLRFSADHEGTDYGAVLAVRRDCEEPDAELACAGDFRDPSPTVVLEDAEPGEYYVIVDGGGPERWVSLGGQINMPNDPQNFRANQDVRQGCGWSDGGNDAFDCYGTFRVEHNGRAAEGFDISVGERQVITGDYRFRLRSNFPHPNVWRVRLDPTLELDERRVSVRISGNLGSDGGTVSRQRQIAFEGRALSYLNTADNFNVPSDPPVVHLVVPSDPDDMPRITYANQRDDVTISARDVKLPIVFYVAIGYTADADVARALLTDVEARVAAGGGDAARFGNFELTVEVDPPAEPE